MNRVCKNCNTHFKGNFCPQCGQKAHTERFTFKHIFSEGIHAFTHADKGFLTLLRKMMHMPGAIAYEYIVEGKRKKYFNLFTFFVLVTTISAFVESKDLALKEKLFDLENHYDYLFNFYSKIFLLVTIPVLAFFIWLVNSSKSKLLYSEYTVFAMVLMALKAMLDIVITIVNYTGTLMTKTPVSLEDHWWYAVVQMLIMGIVAYQFHKKRGYSDKLRGFFSGVSFLIVQTGVILFIVWSTFQQFRGLGILEIYGFRISG